MSPELLGLISTYGPIVVMILIFYFLLYRPQKSEQKRRKELLDNLHKGNKVMTVGGIYGEILEIKDNVLDLKVADKVVIKVSRAAINTNVSQGLSAKEPDAEEETTSEEKK